MSRAPRTHAGWGAEDRRQAVLKLAASTAELDEEQQRSRPGAALLHARIPEVSLRAQRPSPLVIRNRDITSSRRRRRTIGCSVSQIRCPDRFRTLPGYSYAGINLGGDAPPAGERS